MAGELQRALSLGQVRDAHIVGVFEERARYLLRVGKTIRRMFR